MPPVKAQLVTIIAPFDRRKQVADALQHLGARGYSLNHVDGLGVHGHREGGFFESKNLAFMVVATEELAMKILAWVETELAPREAAIAYANEVLAVPGDHF